MPTVYCGRCRTRQYAEPHERAVICESCGRPIPTSKPAKLWPYLTGGTVAAVVGMVTIYSFAARTSKPKIEPVAEAVPAVKPKARAVEAPVQPGRVQGKATGEPAPKAPKEDFTTPSLPPLPQPMSSGVEFVPESPALPPPIAFPKFPAIEVPAPEAKKPFKSDRPARESTPGYFLRTVAGFKVVVSRLAYEESDAAAGVPLSVIDGEVSRLVEIFPERALKALRTVPIWVEWDHVMNGEKNALAVYYGGAGRSLYFQGVDPRKADSICVLTLKRAAELKGKRGVRQTFLLHEFAHAVHHKLYPNDVVIQNAYNQAMTRGLYRSVPHDAAGDGPAYASRNEMEYFAELTCAYLDRLDYLPHDQKELRSYDSVGFEVMTKAWGTPEEIDALRRKTAKKK